MHADVAMSLSCRKLHSHDVPRYVFLCWRHDVAIGLLNPQGCHGRYDHIGEGLNLSAIECVRM